MGGGDISDPLDFHWIPGSYASEFLRTPRPNTVTHHIFQKLESSFELEPELRPPSLLVQLALAGGRFSDYRHACGFSYSFPPYNGADALKPEKNR